VQLANDELSDSPTVHDYRIGEGGLLRRIELAAHLTRLHWQLVVLLCLTWVPLVLLGLSTGNLDALVRDPAVHVRLLLVAPMLLVLDHMFPPLCAYTLTQLQAHAFVPQADRPRLDRLLRSAGRWADAALPEGLLALLALAAGVAALQGFVSLRGLARGSALAADRLWYALTDLPLFQFLLWRSIWRWLIWVRILIGLSRIPLDLVYCHPDRCGGIRFLSLPSMVYCAMLVFAISSVLCAELETRQTLGATLESFSPLLVLFALVGTLIAFGPLLAFAPQLYRARKRGLLELDGYASRCGRRLRAALLDPNGSEGRETIQVMANTEQTYRETVTQLSVFLFQRKDLIVLLAAALLPLIPTILRQVPREDWWALGALLTGWKP
jgi:hypothetical protein